jgi:hypothetical protein
MMAELQITNPDVTAALETIHAWADSIEDPVRQFAAATWVARELTEFVKEVAKLRTSSLRELEAEGYTLPEMADMIGVSKARVKQIIDRESEVGVVPPRWRPTCLWPTATGRPCPRAGVYRTKSGVPVCGTHGGAARAEGLEVFEL